MDELKIEIKEMISCISNCCPELRISQIMVNAAIKGGWNQNDIFYCPDDILLKGLQMIWDEV